jgi:hypothetical protein
MVKKKVGFLVGGFRRVGVVPGTRVSQVPTDYLTERLSSGSLLRIGTSKHTVASPRRSHLGREKKAIPGCAAAAGEMGVVARVRHGTPISVWRGWDLTFIPLLLALSVSSFCPGS